MSVWLRKCALMLLALSLLLGAASAAQKIDLNQECRLYLSYVQNDARLQGVQVEIHRVADVSQSGKFTLAGAFAKASVSSLNGLSDEELRQAAYTLTGYADGKGISGLKTAQSSARGSVSFTGLKPGLYLVVADNLVLGDKVYRFEPMLVSLPGSEAEGDWSYTLNMNPKIEILDRGVTQLKVVKVWKGDQSGDRPDSIRVKLLCNGKLSETVELGAANNWRHTWLALDNAMRWQVAETAVTGYTVSMEQDGQLVTITNTKIEDTPTGGDTVLPQTGLLWWPAPVLAAAGMLLFLLGWLRRRRNEHEEES